MNKGFDEELLGMSERLRGGYTYLLANLGRAVALITALIAGLLVFCDIAFLGFETREFSTSLAVVLTASLVIYFSLEESGERLCEEGAEFQELRRKYEDLRSRIGTEKLPALRLYLENYAKEELTHRKRHALLSLGMTEEEYTAARTSADRKLRRKIGQVDRLKITNITTDILLSDIPKAGGERRDPHSFKYIKLILGILPSMLCMIFTASVILTARELTFESVIEGIVKLSPLPAVAFRGYIGGYNYKKNDESAWIGAKIKLLEGFLRSEGTNNES